MTNKVALRQKAFEISKMAYSPYSKAFVGSAIEMTDGSVYVGCNIENVSFGGTVCAERVAIFKAVSEGKKAIKHVYVYTKDGWPPCGFCRQVIAEFATPDLEVTMGKEDGSEITMKFSELLPLAFTPAHLPV